MPDLKTSLIIVIIIIIIILSKHVLQKIAINNFKNPLLFVKLSKKVLCIWRLFRNRNLQSKTIVIHRLTDWLTDWLYEFRGSYGILLECDAV
jgi:hypothetical protein